MRSLRIAIFISSLSLRRGGPQRVVYNLVHGLATKGLEVDLVQAVKRSEQPPLPLNVNVVWLGARRVSTSILALAHYLQRRRPRVMLSVMEHPNIVAVWAREVSRVPVRLVLSEHTVLSGSRMEGLGLKAEIIKRLTRHTYPRADRIIAVSNGVAEDLRRRLGHREDLISVIYNPVITDEMFRQAEEPVAHPWFTESQDPIILAVGRLSPEKDFGTLLHAFAKVRRALPAKLVILGEGPERSRLESLAVSLNISHVVSMPGFVSNPYPYMKRADVFVLSSVREGLPTALIEAMALGTPVVATDCETGPREILRNGQLGRLVNVGDAGMLAEAIVKAILERGPKVHVNELKLYTLDTAVNSYCRELGLV